MPANTGSGIYKIKIYNREIKLLNSTSDDKKIADIGLSNLEIIYSYIQNSLSFTLSATLPLQIKNSPHNEIKIISVEAYGSTIYQYDLQEKLENLKQCLRIKSLCEKTSLKQSNVNSKEVEIIMGNNDRILPVDFNKRRIFLQENIENVDIRNFINDLDIFTLFALLN